MESAEKALQDAMAQDDDQEASTQAVMAAKVCLDAAEKLLKDAESKAVGAIAKGMADYRYKLSIVRGKSTPYGKQSIDAGIEAAAKFAKQHGLNFQPPSKHNFGYIVVPATLLPDDEPQHIVAKTVAKLHRNQDQDKLERLRAEKTRLGIMIASPPDIALQSLVAERKRQP